MLTADETTKSALRSNQVGAVRAVARYQGAQLPVNVALSGSVRFRGDAKVQATANVQAYGVGNSLVPHAKDAPLATYGQELALWRTSTVRSKTVEIPLGVFRITTAGDAFENYRGDTVLDWTIELGLQDRFESIAADDFLSVDAPKAGNTVWDELRRLSAFPVQEALGNASVPPSTVYESRFDAIVTLTNLLGGVPHLTREGVLTARLRDAWLTVTTPAFDINGTISWSSEMTNDFFNQVQVRNPNDPTIVAYASITDMSNPLAVGRAGGRTFKQAAPIYTTVAAAQSAATTILARVSTKRARTVRVECTPEALLLELGDVGWVRDPVQRRSVLGEVSDISVPLDPTAPIQVELIVAEES